MSCSNHIISAFLSSRRRYHLRIITSVSHPTFYHHAAAIVFVSSRRRYPRLRNYVILASSTNIPYHIGPTHRRSVSYWSYPPSFGIIASSFTSPFGIISSSSTAVMYHISPTHRRSVSFRTPLPPFRIILVLPTSVPYHIGLLYRRRQMQKVRGEPGYAIKVFAL